MSYDINEPQAHWHETVTARKPTWFVSTYTLWERIVWRVRVLFSPWRKEQ